MLVLYIDYRLEIANKAIYYIRVILEFRKKSSIQYIKLEEKKKERKKQKKRKKDQHHPNELIFFYQVLIDDYYKYLLTHMHRTYFTLVQPTPII